MCAPRPARAPPSPGGCPAGCSRRPDDHRHRPVAGRRPAAADRRGADGQRLVRGRQRGPHGRVRLHAAAAGVGCRRGDRGQPPASQPDRLAVPGGGAGLRGRRRDRHLGQARDHGGSRTVTVAWADWLGAIGGELGFLFVLAVLLFPDGRLPSPRWRAAAWLIIAGEALLVLMAVASSAALRAQISAVRVSPVRLIPDGVADPVVNVVQTAFLPLFVAAAAGLGVRYRRATPDVRHQIKWVAYASLLTAAAMLICGLVFGNPLGALLAVGPLIPVAAGIAIFKYRLYDIDVVIGKTIVYGSLAAFITLVYVLIVVGIGSLGSGFGRA